MLDLGGRCLPFTCERKTVQYGAAGNVDYYFMPTSGSRRFNIGGNRGSGIVVSPFSGFVRILNNYVGTDVDGTARLANGGAGVQIWSVVELGAPGALSSPPSFFNLILAEDAHVHRDAAALEVVVELRDEAGRDEPDG